MVFLFCFFFCFFYFIYSSIFFAGAAGFAGDGCAAAATTATGAAGGGGRGCGGTLPAGTSLSFLFISPSSSLRCVAWSSSEAVSAAALLFFFSFCVESFRRGDCFGVQGL